MRRDSWLKMLLVAGALVLSGCGEDAAGDDAAAGGGQGEMQLPVEAVTVAPEPLTRGLQTVGSLRADESVVVRPEVAGRISRIHFEEGGSVEAGQPLFTLDPSTARAALSEAEANLANSRSASERARQLVGEQLIARSDYDTTQAAFAVDRARVETARTALSKMTLGAPFSGRIGLREVSVGDFVTVGQDLVTLVRSDPIEVDFSVPEGALSQVAEGQPIEVTVDAFPGERFPGRIVAVAPTVDAASRSVRLRAQVPNPDLRLRPGQFARLALDTSGAGEALLVPEQALMQEGDTRYVYTVVDGKAVRVDVSTGRRVPGKVEITEGLQAGDVVITAGQAKPMMHEGMGVMVLPAGAADGAGGPAAQPETPAGEAPAEEAPADEAPTEGAQADEAAGTTP